MSFRHATRPVRKGRDDDVRLARKVEALEASLAWWKKQAKRAVKAGAGRARKHP